MKTLEVSSLNEGVDSTLQEIDNIQSKITEMQKGIRGIIELEYYLKGKTGEAIRSFYETVHEPFLIFLYESLIDYAKVLETLKNDVHTYEADENGLVRQDFMEHDVQRGLDKVETVAIGIADEANKVMDNISDIVSLPSLELEEFSHVVQKGRDKVNLHIDQLHELDHKQTKALSEVESDLDLMKSYMSEMTRTFHRDHSISSFNALTPLELTTLPTIMKEVYGEPVTEEKEEDEDNFLMKGLKFVGSTAKGVGTGVYDVGEETVVGVYNTVAHPIQTGAAMWNAVSHPIETSKYIGNAIEESYDRDMVNGDAESRSHWVTYALGMTATSIFGTKGAGTVTKAGTTTAKTGAAAAKTGVANASKKVSEFDMSNLFPFGPQYQVATGGYVPFNVVDGKHLKDQLILKAESLDAKGTGKGSRLKLENSTKGILETKPMNSPIPEKWYKKGGSISIDDNGIWIYTNKSGTSVSYPNGYPDFTPYIHPNVKPVKIEIHSPKNNLRDFESANKSAKLTKDTDPPITDIRKPPDGYTWHHHEDGKTMMLVDEDVHREFRHIGGQSKINGKNK